MTFANSIDPDKTAHNEPSHLDLRCLTFSLSALHINFFPSGSLFKKKTDNKCRLKDTERDNQVILYWPCYMSEVCCIGPRPKAKGQYSRSRTCDWASMKLLG